MKRYGHLWEQIVAFDNFVLAAEKTLRGHNRKPSITRFCFHLESELFKLQEELNRGTYRPSPFHAFWIFEPKPRQICAAPVRDRIVHHAICNVLDPIFERRMIFDTYACRRGKGSHAAVRRAQEMARRWPYYLQGDVQQYFASIPHEQLQTLLRRLLKDHHVLSLLGLIINQEVPGSLPGRGLPIGNLTSQYLANLYLGELDHYLLERVGADGYVRYMDDFLVFGQNKDQLWQVQEAAAGFLADKLDLQFKKKSLVVAPTVSGISFLGFRVFPSLLRLQGLKLRRFRHNVRQKVKQYAAGEVTEEDMTRSLASMFGHLGQADTLALRRQLVAELWPNG